MLKRRAVLAGLGSLAVPRRPFADEPAADLADACGSMLMMGFYGDSLTSTGTRVIADHLASGRVGGVLLFDDNLVSPGAARELIGFLRTQSKVGSPFMAVDQEGGAVVRLTHAHGFLNLPAARTVADLPPDEVRRLYGRTAQELHGLGINLNFAPVVDLDLNPRNPIIGALGRSFGSDAATVVADAKLFIDAHRKAHVLTALKHFPGHGSAGADSHRTLPNVSGLWSSEELRPFATLIGAGYADMVMVGHLTGRDFTEDERPASLSQRAVLTILRKRLGFEGVVVADDMQMGALRRSYPPDESIALALEAGVDLFVFSNREHPDAELPDRFHRVVRQAIAAGRLTPARIQLSARRIALLKQSLA